MVKFLHTADWQMGARSQQLGPKAPEGRKVRLQAIRNVVSAAKRENVDFVLIAGDTFENLNVDDSTVRSTVDVLNDLEPIPTFIVPGNHDPYIPGSIWHRRSWKGVGQHINLLTEPEEWKFGENVTIYPCPLKQKNGGFDPTDWIPSRAEGDTRIRVGLAHGTLDTIQDQDFPISGERAQKSNLDYLALGHWHGFSQRGKVVYSGTPEQTSYTEKNPGNVVIVTIDEAGQEPALQLEEVGILRWVELESSILDITDVDSLERQISDMGSQDRTVLKVRPKLSDDIQEAAINKIFGLINSLTNKLWYLDWSPESVNIGGFISCKLPPGMFGTVEDILLKLSKGEHPGGHFDHLEVNHSQEVASESLRLLYQLASEGRNDDY